jgi:endonuclease YncB( thermonuclease family)
MAAEGGGMAVRAGAALALALALALAGLAAAEEARVTDGDTLTVGAVQVRLFGVDAPELRQRCPAAGGGDWPCGKAAAARLAALVAAGPVRCEPQNTDRYGRLVSICTAAGADLGGALVAEGLARAYLRYSDAYAADETAARAAGRGLWQGEATAPWEYRAEAAEGFAPAADGAAPDGCAIKGNLGKGGARIFHRPGEPAYGRTRIDPRRGEAWFCDEASARAAGFRPARGE